MSNWNNINMLLALFQVYCGLNRCLKTNLGTWAINKMILWENKLHIAQKAPIWSSLREQYTANI